jgi:hypothetical protein
MGPLRAWATDLQQPNLTEFGRRFLRSLAVRDLARRLRVLHTLREHPEIAEVPIPRIVYITGLERSGTTLLHNLLALHPQARALLRWELMEPVPPPTAQTHATDPRIGAVQASLDKLRGSPLERMHWVNADEPEECAWGFIDSVSMLGQAPAMCMPAWRRFLAEEDLTPAYEHYRRVVQLLLWKHPVGPDGFLVLKAPQISRHVAAFVQSTKADIVGPLIARSFDRPCHRRAALWDRIQAASSRSVISWSATDSMSWTTSASMALSS